MNSLIAWDTIKVSFPGLGIKDIDVNRIAVKLGSVEVYWYGVLIAVGVCLAVILAMTQAKKNKMSADLILDYGLLCVPAALVGARLYYVFSSWGDYYVKGDFGKTISNIVDFRSGGLAVYGGVIAALIAAIAMSKIRKIPISAIIDYAIIYIPLGQAIGRWGNFFNQEAFGTNTNLPWGMISTETKWYLQTYCPTLDPSQPVHPTFLYESIATILIFVGLYFIRKHSKRAYTTTASYMIFYGIVRFFIEGLRTDSLYIGETSLRTSQVVSVVLVVMGFLLIACARIFDWQRMPIPERFLTGNKASADATNIEEASIETTESTTESTTATTDKAEEAKEDAVDDPDIEVESDKEEADEKKLVDSEEIDDASTNE